MLHVVFRLLFVECCFVVCRGFGVCCALCSVVCSSLFVVRCLLCVSCCLLLVVCLLFVYFFGVRCAGFVVGCFVVVVRYLLLVGVVFV